jgi:UDP-N-acetylglucosamine--N-acetylmuramyl-(pentapeptide) pyrophosphoryl-undecaprenol N-acetylglucosamine transferase
MVNRIAISGGGTGGHTYPAMAVAEKLKELGVDLLFIGRRGGMEEGACAERGIRFVGLPIIPTPRGVGMGLYLGRILLGTLGSLLALRRFGAELVLGMGGYVCIPAVVSGKILGIPVAIHEQNAVPGKANRRLARISDLVMISFESSRRHFPPGVMVVLTGNPIRNGIVGVGKGEAREKLGIRGDIGTVLVLGGSYGSRRICEAAMEAMRITRGRGEVLQFILISGHAFYEEALMKAKDLGLDLKLIPFCREMGVVYGASDLVVSSAGATTIAEICACGLPSILIPKSHAVGRHQEMNAMALASEGAAVIIREEELGGELLASEISRIMGDEGLRKAMGEKARAIGRPDAADEVSRRLLELVSGRGR